MDRLGEGEAGRCLEGGAGTCLEGGAGRCLEGGAGTCLEGGAGRCLEGEGGLEVLSHHPVHGWCYVGSRVHLHRAAQTNCTSLHVT